jgi:hypothetical protein
MNARLPLYLFAYKIACLLVGLACIFMGYRLFLEGVFAPATLEAAKGQATLSLQNAAPGTFFALFGSVVVAFVVWQGLHFESSKEDQDKFRESAVAAKEHWQGVWQALYRLEQDGKVAHDDFSLIRLQLAGLAASLTDITGEQVSESNRKEKFVGFAAPPG